MEILSPSSGKLKSYVIGFGLSLLCTYLAYSAAVNHIHNTAYILVGLAIIQLFVQLFAFLHLNEEGKPHHNLFILSFASLMVIILVFGSLWIMKNLNYNMSPDQVTNYMFSQEAIQK